MLSSALIIANDGITDPATKTINDFSYGPGSLKRIEHTNPHYVRILLVEHMRAGMVVDRFTAQSNSGARFKLDGTDVMKIVEPKAPAGPSDPTPYSDNQINLVLAAADQRADRLPEIILQQTDLLSFLGSTVLVHDVSHKWTLEVLRSVQDVATIIHSQVKHHLSTPRPVDVFPEASPIIQTPQHSSLPSGHSVEATAIAYVLSRLAGRTDGKRTASGKRPAKHVLNNANLVMRMSARIAMNRHVAGVHFPFESMAGFFLGVAIGRICYRRLSNRATPLKAVTVNAQLMGDVDFYLDAFQKAEELEPGASAPAWLNHGGPVSIGTGTAELQHVFALAEAEWRQQVA
ncbi:MAG: phosphatase PAP2 family protein [Pseudomonadota bacterium]